MIITKSCALTEACGRENPFLTEYINVVPRIIEVKEICRGKRHKYPENKSRVYLHSLIMSSSSIPSSQRSHMLLNLTLINFSFGKKKEPRNLFSDCQLFINKVTIHYVPAAFCAL